MIVLRCFNIQEGEVNLKCVLINGKFHVITFQCARGKILMTSVVFVYFSGLVTVV